MRRAVAAGALVLAALAGEAAPSPEPAGQCLELPGEAGVLACREALGQALSKHRAAALRGILASKLAALGRWEEVVAVHRETVRLDPASADGYLRLAAALIHGVGHPEDALPILREAARLDPSDADPWGAQGTALAALGRAGEAAEAFAEAARRDPTWLERHPASQAASEAASRGQAWP